MAPPVGPASATLAFAVCSGWLLGFPGLNQMIQPVKEEPPVSSSTDLRLKALEHSTDAQKPHVEDPHEKRRHALQSATLPPSFVAEWCTLEDGMCSLEEGPETVVMWTDSTVPDAHLVEEELQTGAHAIAHETAFTDIAEDVDVSTAPVQLVVESPSVQGAQEYSFPIACVGFFLATLSVDCVLVLLFCVCCMQRRSSEESTSASDSESECSESEVMVEAGDCIDGGEKRSPLGVRWSEKQLSQVLPTSRALVLDAPSPCRAMAASSAAVTSEWPGDASVVDDDAAHSKDSDAEIFGQTRDARVASPSFEQSASDAVAAEGEDAQHAAPHTVPVEEDSDSELLEQACDAHVTSQSSDQFACDGVAADGEDAQPEVSHLVTSEQDDRSPDHDVASAPDAGNALFDGPVDDDVVAYADDLLQQRWVTEACDSVIFEDEADERRFHEQRSRAFGHVLRAFAQVRSENETIREQGASLLEDMDRLQEDYRLALGDVAYYKVLAETTDANEEQAGETDAVA